ncbi:CD99 antigen-like protein 2 isoform X2 [Acanthochromis polyacanthus]|uniref:CD99 antigen-like protein 2 isoform X2 n=1 Tax=Acanthochromis polyacanthus TaxID=80966 RepID=UPI000B8F8A10|nr:CD99 antigen-like protein 2 isoform X2 [Acanthochromis polyacanthus]
MALRSLCALYLLLLLQLLPLQVLSQGEFDLSDALDDKTPPPATPKPAAPEGDPIPDLLDFDDPKIPTKAPPKVVPKVPTSTKAPVKPKPKPASDDFDLADALDPNNDIGGKDKNKGQGGGFSDSDLIDVSNDNTYKPDKAKGRPSGDKDQINQYDDSGETTAEVGTIAGIASAVAMALVGAISSYISYQKKKFCFSIQQSLNTDMVKADNPDTVVATEPQVQQTLLEPPNAEPPTEENAV